MLAENYERERPCSFSRFSTSESGGFLNLESAVGRHAEYVFYREWQGAMRQNSRPIVAIRNAASRDKKCAMRVVAAYLMGEHSLKPYIIMHITMLIHPGSGQLWNLG